MCNIRLPRGRTWPSTAAHHVNHRCAEASWRQRTLDCFLRTLSLLSVRLPSRLAEVESASASVEAVLVLSVEEKDAGEVGVDVTGDSIPCASLDDADDADDADAHDALEDCRLVNARATFFNEEWPWCGNRRLILFPIASQGKKAKGGKQHNLLLRLTRNVSG